MWRSPQAPAETRANTQHPAKKKANRERLTFRDWWWGGSGQQTLSISALWLVRTAAGLRGWRRYVALSRWMMNRSYHELGSRLAFSTVSLNPLNAHGPAPHSTRLPKACTACTHCTTLVAQEFSTFARSARTIDQCCPVNSLSHPGEGGGEGIK